MNNPFIRTRALRILSVLTVAVAILLPAIPASASPPARTFTGQVINGNDVGVGGVCITVTGDGDLGPAGHWSAITAGNGTYAISSLPLGRNIEYIFRFVPACGKHSNYVNDSSLWTTGQSDGSVTFRSSVFSKSTYPPLHHKPTLGGISYTTPTSFTFERIFTCPTGTYGTRHGLSATFSDTNRFKRTALGPIVAVDNAATAVIVDARGASWQSGHCYSAATAPITQAECVAAGDVWLQIGPTCSPPAMLIPGGKYTYSRTFTCQSETPLWHRSETFNADATSLAAARKVVNQEGATWLVLYCP